MANIPNDRKYTKTHEWARPNDDLVEVGITDFAQHQLSDITYVELPETGRHFSAGEEMVVVESIKAAADVYAPVSGTIMEVNSSLADNPGVINTDPHGAGWLVQIKPDNPKDLDALLSAADYEAHAAKEH
ncbi:MAG: glycine cleavage system protein GcvH [Kiritimatiellia bacterium]|nr:glycine cleavage system protein GcvH [Kiritimatiellia bacterium]